MDFKSPTVHIFLDDGTILSGNSSGSFGGGNPSSLDDIDLPSRTYPGVTEPDNPDPVEGELTLIPDWAISPGNPGFDNNQLLVVLYIVFPPDEFGETPAPEIAPSVNGFWTYDVTDSYGNFIASGTDEPGPSDYWLIGSDIYPGGGAAGTASFTSVDGDTYNCIIDIPGF